MHVIHARNVNEAYTRALHWLNGCFVEKESRNGPVLYAPQTVTTHYHEPRERVLWSAQRDANPFFHLFESLWMLAGGRDVDTLKYLVPSIAQYSDNGVDFHGAYGFRWRHHFHTETAFQPIDQVVQVIHMLRADPETRRAYIAMWDPCVDLSRISKDLPCNVGAKFEIHDGKLNMMVFNRSNDIIWGCYGANVVQFSMLQEYIAACVGVEVGWYEQISTNFHAYKDTWTKVWPHAPHDDAYLSDAIIHELVTNPSTFLMDCIYFMAQFQQSRAVLPAMTTHLGNRFFHAVAGPMSVAYHTYRTVGPARAHTFLQDSLNRHGPVDWIMAGAAWMARRAARRYHTPNHG
jgi:thymidylate synthase